MVACQDVHLTPAQRHIVDFFAGACRRRMLEGPLAQEVGCSVKRSIARSLISGMRASSWRRLVLRKAARSSPMCTDLSTKTIACSVHARAPSRRALAERHA